MAAFQRLFKASVAPAVAASAVACASISVAAAEEGVVPGRAPTGEKVRSRPDRQRVVVVQAVGGGVEA